MSLRSDLDSAPALPNPDLRVLPLPSPPYLSIQRVLPHIEAGCLAAAPLAPSTAGLMTVVCVAAEGQFPGWGSGSGHPLIPMLLLFLAGWLIVAVPCFALGLASAERVNPGSYGELVSRLNELKASCKPCSGKVAFERRDAVYRSISLQIDSIEADLLRRDLRWLLGSGYITLWRRLHGAEALLNLSEPTTRVMARAEENLARLAQSSIAGAPEMSVKLQQALQSLNNAADPARPYPGEERPAVGADAPVPYSRSKDSVHAKDRVTVWQIQRTISEYRTNRYGGLVAVRKQIIGASGITGLTLYGLLWLAIASGPSSVDPKVLVAAAGCYLLGGLVGLFNLLYLQARSDAAIDDYGLTVARLFVTPQLAGLAAVLGVITASVIGSTQTRVLNLGASFNLMEHPANILVAAAVALSPGIVLRQLRRRMEEYKEELGSSQQGKPRDRQGSNDAVSS